MAICLLTFSLSFVSCSDSNSDSSANTTSLLFMALDGSYDIYGEKSESNYKELMESVNAQIKEVLDGKQEVVIEKSKVDELKNKLKESLEAFAGKVNASKKYPGSYIINVKCNLEKWIYLSFDTPIEHEFLTIGDPEIYYYTENGEKIIVKEGDILPDTVIITSINIEAKRPDFDIDYDKYVNNKIDVTVYNAYDEKVSYYENKCDFMKKLKITKSYKTVFNTFSYTDGGEYSYVITNDIFNTTDKTNITIAQDPGIIVSVSDSIKIHYTTGYPFDPKDYTKVIDVEYSIKKIADKSEVEVNNKKESITLVNDASRTKVASVYDNNVFDVSNLTEGKYVFEVKSNWSLANGSFKFEVEKAAE